MLPSAFSPSPPVSSESSASEAHRVDQLSPVFGLQGGFIFWQLRAYGYNLEFPLKHQTINHEMSSVRINILSLHSLVSSQ